MAYTTVTARRHFTKPLVQNPGPMTPPPDNNNKPAKSQRKWPPSVRAYVQRSFAENNSIEGVSREDMETKLKQVISEAADKDRLEIVDWLNLPLPQQLILDERNQMNTSQTHTSPLAKTNEQFSNMQVTSDSPSNGTLSKKRKSTDQPGRDLSEERTPPWRTTKNKNAFEDRITVPEKRPRIEATGGNFSKSQASIESRKKRFQHMQSGPSSTFANPAFSQSAPPTIVDNGPVVGRCQDLEKKYLRLTAAPNPDTVRPLYILEKTLSHLKEKWRVDRNYSYICDQFKSLRQDLTVQHIRTDFTVNVYEIHARIALEKADLGEYNQCQTQLRALYAMNLHGHPTEFKAYRILYLIHTCNRTDMNDVLADLTPTEKADESIKHALETRSALALGNYHRFFKLFLSTPNMGAYLMDMFVNRERLAALANMCKAYKPSINLRLVAEELAFESDEQAAHFICDHGGSDYLVSRDGEVVLTTSKESTNVFDEARKQAFSKVDIKGQI